MPSSNYMPDAARDPDAYVRSLLDMLGDRDPLAVMAELPGAVEQLVADVSNDSLRMPEAPDKWSIIEVIGHLFDTELVYRYRVVMILAHDAPEIQGYDEEAWVTVLGHQDAHLGELMVRLRELRNANLGLYGSLNDEQLARYGVHSERGNESIGETITLLGAHDLVHRNQIARIKDVLGVP